MLVLARGREVLCRRWLKCEIKIASGRGRQNRKHQASNRLAQLLSSLRIEFRNHEARKEFRIIFVFGDCCARICTASEGRKPEPLASALASWLSKLPGTDG